jgi:outer membrane immunogenic protein
MKRGLLAIAALIAPMVATPSFAADVPARMPVKAPPIVAPIPVFNWTGFYVGGHFGYLWAHNNVEEAEIIIVEGHTNGVVGGVLGGANWQIGPVVLGAEADIGWSNAHGSKLGLSDELFEYNIHWTSHVRGRLGYAVLPGTLVYVAGGLAVTHDTVRMFELLPPMVCGGTFTGGSIGGGVEQAFTRQISGRLEYLYDNFGHKTYTMADDSYRVGVTGNTVRGAVVFRFGP